MSTAGKAIAVTVVAIAAVAVWRSARRPDEPLPSTPASERAAPGLRTKPGGDPANVRQSAPAKDSIEQQVARLSGRHGSSRGDTTVSGGGREQSSQAEAFATRARGGGRRAPARAGATGGSEENDFEDPEAVAASAAEFAELKQKALTDPDPEERIDALGSLYPFDDAEVIPILQTAFRDHDPEVRIAALERLNDLNEPPVDLIGAGMTDSSPEVRERTITILSGIDDERAQALIRDARNDSNEDVRTTAELYAEDPDLDSDSESVEQ